MANNHIQRINDDIRFHLSTLRRGIKDPRVNQGKLLSIVRTDTTGDFRSCKVYISVLGECNEKELKKGLKSCAPYLRRELGQSLSLRYTPELIFEIDHSMEQGAHISALIEALDLPHDEEEEESEGL